MRIRSSILLLIICIALTSCFYACEKPLELNASVTNRGSELIIINEDSFSWFDVEMYINYNERDLSSGYNYHVDFITPGIWCFVSNYEFRNPDGKQFWIYDEVNSLLIRAKTSDNRTGTYKIEWSNTP